MAFALFSPDTHPPPFTPHFCFHLFFRPMIVSWFSDLETDRVVVVVTGCRPSDLDVWPPPPLPPTLLFPPCPPPPPLPPRKKDKEEGRNAFSLQLVTDMKKKMKKNPADSSVCNDQCLFSEPANRSTVSAAVTCTLRTISFKLCLTIHLLWWWSIHFHSSLDDLDILSEMLQNQTHTHTNTHTHQFSCTDAVELTWSSTCSYPFQWPWPTFKIAGLDPLSRSQEQQKRE